MHVQLYNYFLIDCTRAKNENYTEYSAQRILLDLHITLWLPHPVDFANYLIKIEKKSCFSFTLL